MDWLSKRLGLVVLSAVAAVAVGGIAYASIPDSSGVIHGCYKKDGTHQLRVIDPETSPSKEKCSGSEKPLDWNQTGPIGSTGPTGPTGTTGATGDTGPSDGGEAGTLNNTTILAHAAAQPVVGTTISNMPAGDYVFSGSAFISPVGGSVTAECYVGGSTLGTWGGHVATAPTQTSTPQWIPLVGKLHLNVAQPIQMLCDETGTVHQYLAGGGFVVTRVGTMH